MDALADSDEPCPLVPAWARTRGRVYWYDQYVLNEQDTAFASYDPDRIAQELLRTGADIIAIYAANQYGIAYYPSAIWPQHPNLMGRDYVRDLVTRLRAHNRRVVLYINWLDSKHPEWSTVRLGAQGPPDAGGDCALASWADPDRPNGRVRALPGGQWQLPCLNSPKREQVVELASEIVGRYRPDAFHLDMFYDPDICVCSYCRPALEEICGTADITEDAIREHWCEYIDWRCARTDALFSDLARVLWRQGVLAAHNGFAPLFMPALAGMSEETFDWLDVHVSESFEAIGVACTDLNSTSINVRWQHAIGKPSWILRLYSPIHYAHWTITPAQWQLSAAACKANGGKVFGPCGMGARPDTTTAQAAQDVVAGAFDFYMKDADLDTDAESCARVALLFSWATRKYDQSDGAGMQWSEELNGWGRLLIEEHVPFDMMVAERVTAASALDKYDLLVLPNLHSLSDRCCDLIRSYVRGGGGVLATAETSMGDERGARRADFALGDVLGVRSEAWSDGPFAIGGHAEPEPAFGRRRLVSTAGDVVASIVAVDPAGSVAGVEDPMPMQPTPWPMAVHHGFGAGQAIYAAFAIGRYYTLHGDAHIARWMAELMDRLLPSRQLQVIAPRTVEVTLWRQPQVPRTIIHLANRTVPWTLPTDTRQITEIVPVHGLEVRMPSPYGRSHVSCRGADAVARVDGDHLVVRVSALEAYAAIVIEPAVTARGGIGA